MNKIGFLFGAGAEISYGMPSGGKFALDIFRQSSEPGKQKLRDMRKNIDKRSTYASRWLPNDYDKKSISSFGQRVFDTIIRDTIGNNRNKIINKINHFDSLAEQSAKSIYSDNPEDALDSLNQRIETDLGHGIDYMNINQQLAYNDLFKAGDNLFSNQYFATLIYYYKDFKDFNDGDRNVLKELIIAIFQLQIGALSETLSRELEDSIFKKDELNLDIFDDLGGTLNVNYEAAGIAGLKLLSNEYKNDTWHPIVKFAYKIIEQIYSDVLDYKTLIDSNWHFLYNPKTEWGKFSKIIVFLYTVQEYIKNEAEALDKNKSGYYSDLKMELESNKIEQSVIGTTNYGSFIKEVLKTDISFLNGGIDIYYDPYMNSIVDYTDSKHILVPLLFTQSGTKPMTSIDMLERYVDFYRSLKDSNIICSIGFGFNQDDEHINGIIRTLIERDDKKLVVVDTNSSKRLTDKRTELCGKLKISKQENLDFITVDKYTRKTKDGSMWYDDLIAKLSNIDIK